MSNFKNCTLCGVHDYFGPSSFMQHKCKPKWECRGDWEDDDCWQTVYASDAEDAAERYADRYDCESGDYPIIGGRNREPTIILVRKSVKDDDEALPTERWSIEAEMVPHYSAYKIEAEAAE